MKGMSRLRPDSDRTRELGHASVTDNPDAITQTDKPLIDNRVVVELCLVR